MNKENIKQFFLGSSLDTKMARPFYIFLLVFIRWIIGLIFIICGIMGICSNEQPISSFLSLLLGLLFLPASSFIITKLTRINSNIKSLAAFIILIFFFIGINIEKSPTLVKEEMQRKQAEQLVIKQQNEAHKQLLIKKNKEYQAEVKLIDKYVNNLIKNNLIQKIDISTNSVYLYDTVWDLLNIDQKTIFSANMSEYMYLKQYKNLDDMNLAYCHIYSYQTGKELAYYNIGGLKIK